jgi:outer membrane protein
MLHKTPLSVFFMLCISLSAAQAQAPKYGHMNLGNFLEQMPETKTANDKLKVFADKLTAKDDSLTKAFQAAVTEFQKQYESRTMTPIQAQSREAELQKEQEAIQKFEAEAQQKIAAERDELLRPILTKVEEAIKSVAGENGYMMIFDTSTGAMLFAKETEDVTALVKKKLGI